MGELTAIMIGGGVINPTDSTTQGKKFLHWRNEAEPRHNFPIRFTSKEKVIISGVVSINGACQSNTVQRWSSFIASLKNLGTTPEYWQYTEFQAGMAVMGQQFVGGRSNSTTLGLGTQELAGNITFAGNLIESPTTWSTLQPGVIQALKQDSSNIKLWYDGLITRPNFQELQSFTRRLIRHILLVLRDTAIDCDHKTFRIACPQEQCATFACMTTLCFESQEHKCQGTTPCHCPSLDTAVQQLRTHKEPIVIQTQAWSLEIDAMYWIGSPESGLQAKVVKPANSTTLRLQVSKSRIPQKTRARLGAMSRKRDRLRERQIDTWPAEDVLVLSQ
ncbi:hypothetical protein BDZ45DRAFT_747338 [Acephala macrosclerotiorum]|nr:hypothetical protein BDZ45DRAFT_747338 [Acephala macrosclerotiorum]